MWVVRPWRRPDAQVNSALDHCRVTGNPSVELDRRDGIPNFSVADNRGAISRGGSATSTDSGVFVKVDYSRLSVYVYIGLRDVRANLPRTEILKEDRGQGGPRNVVILAREEPATSIRKRRRH